MRASSALTTSSYGGGVPSKSMTEATCMCAPSRSRCRNVASRALRRSPCGTGPRFCPARASLAIPSRLMPVRGMAFLDVIEPYYRHAQAGHDGLDWFDAHTHIGDQDPDGQRATADEILEGLDR